MRLKRFISALVLVLTVVIALAQSNYKVISNAPLNIREKPSLKAGILGVFSSGSLIVVESNKNGWAKVKYSDGFGYVQAQYIEQIVNKSTNFPFEDSANINEHATSTDNTILNSKYKSVVASGMDFDSQRKSSTYEITYVASSFENVKLSGTYGISWSILPWKLVPRLYSGVHFSAPNFNFGLSDFIYGEIRFGPVIGYYFTPYIFISIPLDVICDVYFDDNDETKTAWGLALAPSVYIGRKGGVFLGPQFSFGFSGDSKVFCGFRAGVYF